MSTTFHYAGFDIPVDLARITGGGEEVWHINTVAHLLAYENYCPIKPDQHVLEIGCGVGRDAIGLSMVLAPEGRYTGIDISRPSIEWCQSHITPRFPNFEFRYLNIESQVYNPGGSLGVREVALPIESDTVDRIILQSVFTHMFEDDIVHYLEEFRRALRPDGRVFATWFLLDDESLTMAQSVPDCALTFRFGYGDGCLIIDEMRPEWAVGFTPAAFARILRRGGFELDQPVHRGTWCGREGVTDGQDVTVLRPIS